MRVLYRYLAHQKNQTCFQTNGSQMESSSLSMCLGNPRKKSGETLIFTVCIVMYNILPQNAGHSADWSIEESKEAHSSFLSYKFRGIHSLTIKERGWQWQLFMQTLVMMSVDTIVCIPYDSSPLSPMMLNSKTQCWFRAQLEVKLT